MSARSDSRGAAVDDPAWIRARYEEAKELINDLRTEADIGGGVTLDPELRERVEEFYAATFFDICTTGGVDCACNS